MPHQRLALPRVERGKVGALLLVSCALETFRRQALIREWQRCASSTSGFLDEPIPDEARQPTGVGARQDRVAGGRFPQPFTVEVRGARFFACEKRRADLYRARAQAQRGSHPSAIGDATRRNDGDIHSVCHLRHEAHCAHEGILSALQKRRSMSAPASHPVASTRSTPAAFIDQCFLDRGRRTNRDDAASAACIENVRRWDAEDEAEDGRARVEHGLNLLLKVFGGAQFSDDAANLRRRIGLRSE